MAALTAKENGIDSFLLIHDSFACLPSDMEQFSNIVRYTLVDLYENWDPLQDLYDRCMAQLPEKLQKKLPPPPSKGNLDLERTRESLYAFA
jgi:DNA-directed RNA polymerase